MPAKYLERGTEISEPVKFCVNPTNQLLCFEILAFTKTMETSKQGPTRGMIEKEGNARVDFRDFINCMI